MCLRKIDSCSSAVHNILPSLENVHPLLLWENNFVFNLFKPTLIKKNKYNQLNCLTDEVSICAFDDFGLQSPHLSFL